MCISVFVVCDRGMFGKLFVKYVCRFSMIFNWKKIKFFINSVIISCMLYMEYIFVS